MGATSLLFVSIILGCMIAPHPTGGCRCVPVADDQTTRWGGNEVIVVKERKVYRRLAGTVIYEDDTPASGALVEVFTHPEYLFLKSPESEEKKKEQHRIAACITGEDGKFCFGYIPAGKYEMRISQRSDFDVTKIYVRVSPDGWGTKIEALLRPGT